MAVNPTAVQDLSALGLYLQKAGESAPARQRTEDALLRAPKDPQVWYRAAAVHALAGRARRRPWRRWSRRSALGLSKSRAASDDDFASLRGQPRFAALTGQ